MTIAQYASAGFLIVGTVFMLVAAVGVMRLPDLFTRMHAITKASTAGIGSIMIAVVLSFGTASTAARALAVLLFVAFTAPVAAHMISRAAYLSDAELWSGTFVDHLREHGRSDRRVVVERRTDLGAATTSEPEVPPASRELPGGDEDVDELEAED